MVIAARNAAGTLPLALDSVLAQTLAPREIVVVDDGSTDGTAEVARAHGAARCISQPHRGVSAARNRGIAAATGQWVAILDADDAWAPWRLERVAEVVATRGPCFVGPDAWVWRPPETTSDARARDERVFAARRTGVRRSLRSAVERRVLRRALCQRPRHAPGGAAQRPAGAAVRRGPGPRRGHGVGLAPCGGRPTGMPAPGAPWLLPRPGRA